MEKFNLHQIIASMENRPLNKEVICSSNHLKALVISLKAGNTIPPCKMENDVLFYIITGKGTITVDNCSTLVSNGDCVLVPRTASTRSISADCDMEILAVQGLYR